MCVGVLTPTPGRCHPRGRGVVRGPVHPKLSRPKLSGVLSDQNFSLCFQVNSSMGSCRRMGNCQGVLSDRSCHPRICKGSVSDRSCQVTTSRGGGYSSPLCQHLETLGMCPLQGPSGPNRDAPCWVRQCPPGTF